MVQISTWCHQMVEKPKPVHRYNLSINGCDRSDQMVTYYGNYKRNTIKWWENIFYWVIDVSQVNDHSLYNISHSVNKIMPFKDFKGCLVSQLTEKAASILPPEVAATSSDKLGQELKDGNKIRKT